MLALFSFRVFPWLLLFLIGVDEDVKQQSTQRADAENRQKRQNDDDFE